MEIDNSSAVSSWLPIASELMNDHAEDGVDQRSNPNIIEIRSLSFVLTFTNLTYNIKPPRKITVLRFFQKYPVQDTRTTLLCNITGEARNGEILGVLGPSGSGKSTLIDALANRIGKESLQGSITLNGEALDSQVVKANSAYVMQDDLLYSMLTVEETLMFAAEFKLSSSISKSTKKARVQALIDKLGLGSAANTVIGDEGYRGVSGGERRRVSIGTEIIHEPIVLFLDEPTSGLDSTSAFMVVEVLQRIARSGSIVVMAVHQPSYRIDSLLDKVMFLSHGTIIYSGPPSGLPSFFSEYGHSIPENENRVEFILDLIHELDASPGGTTSLVEFYKYWQTTEYQRKRDFFPNVSELRLFLKSKSNHSICREIYILSRRSILNSRRLPEVIGMKMGVTLVTGSILATIFWRLDYSPKGLQERFGVFLFATITPFYSCAFGFPVFIQERYIFMREAASNMYRRSSYVISHSVLDLFSLALLSLVFASTIFWSVGLSGGQLGFLFFLSVTFASYWAAISFITFLSGVVPNLNSGYTIVFMNLGLFFLFSGFIINADRIPSYWIWLNYISLMKYPYEALLMNEFDEPSECFVTGTSIFDTMPLGVITGSTKSRLLKTLSSILGVNINSTSCIIAGPYILKKNGFTDGLSKWDCLWIIIACGFFFRILFYFTLLWGNNNKRK